MGFSYNFTKYTLKDICADSFCISWILSSHVASFMLHDRCSAANFTNNLFPLLIQYADIDECAPTSYEQL